MLLSSVCCFACSMPLSFAWFFVWRFLAGLAGGVIMVLAASTILAQGVLFVAISYCISAIWERDLGVFQRYLVSLPPLSVLVVGEALLVVVRAQASIHRLAPKSIEERRCNPPSVSESKAGLRGGWRITCPGKAVQFCEFNGARFLRISAAIKGRSPVGRCRCRPAGSFEHHCLR
jgi:uncharacterized MFS-type transporter YbfB